MARRTRIWIDYTLCGDGRGTDPRACGRCLRACAPGGLPDAPDHGRRGAGPLRPAGVACDAPVAVAVHPVHEVRRGLSRESDQGERMRNEGCTLGLGTCLVIGGSGMLGFEIVRQLLAQGERVRVLDIAPLPGGAPPACPPGADCEAMIGDIRDAGAVARACRGVQTVFQTAAAVWDPRTPRRLYEEVNVGGNRLVIEECRRSGVRRLVYTSSMDVVVDGSRPIVEGDESLPYPARMPRDAYSRTKIVSEKMVLAANGAGLATCVLRPVGMYGPRDRYHLGNIIGMAQARSLDAAGRRVSEVQPRLLGERGARAHPRRAQALRPAGQWQGSATSSATTSPTRTCSTSWSRSCGDWGCPCRPARSPTGWPWRWPRWPSCVAPRSNFNRFAVIQTCVDHTFSYARAERELGYAPIVPPDEAFRRSLEWLARGDVRPREPAPRQRPAGGPPAARARSTGRPGRPPR